MSSMSPREPDSTRIDPDLARIRRGFDGFNSDLGGWTQPRGRPRGHPRRRRRARTRTRRGGQRRAWVRRE